MHVFNFTPFPQLDTARLTLRQMHLADDHEVFAIRSDERVNEFLDRPKTHSLEEARHFINKISKGIADNELLYWAITLKSNPAFIGAVGYWNISGDKGSAEIGYELHPDHQGRGIMGEALLKVIDYGFDTMKLNAIEASLVPQNLRSVQLLEKLGFSISSHLQDMVVYTLGSASVSQSSPH